MDKKNLIVSTIVGGVVIGAGVLAFLNRKLLREKKKKLEKFIYDVLAKREGLPVDE